MTRPLHGTWTVTKVDQATVDRIAAAHAPDPLATELGVDIVGDPNREDDDGYTWHSPRQITPTSETWHDLIRLPDGRLLYAYCALDNTPGLTASPPMRLCAMNASGTVALRCGGTP